MFVLVDAIAKCMCLEDRECCKVGEMALGLILDTASVLVGDKEKVRGACEGVCVCMCVCVFMYRVYVHCVLYVCVHGHSPPLFFICPLIDTYHCRQWTCPFSL